MSRLDWLILTILIPIATISILKIAGYAPIVDLFKALGLAR